MKIQELLKEDKAKIGVLVSLSNGRMLYITEEAVVGEDTEVIRLDTRKLYDVAMRAMGGQGGQLQCMATQTADMPTKSREVVIMKDKIQAIDILDEGSFVYQAVVQARSGIVKPQGKRPRMDVVRK